MARIRSVHPGLWTDEDFVGLSEASQIFLIGLGTEADDFGLFDWKPTTLRIRLRPSKDGSVEPLLAELVAAKWVRMYEMNGRKLGAIRNFCHHQSPRFPKNLFPFTREIGTFVGLTPADAAKACAQDDPLQRNVESEGVKEPPFRTERSGEELSGEEKKETMSADADGVPSSKPKAQENRYPADFEQFWTAYGKRENSPKPKAFKAWKRTASIRPPLPELLRCVASYLSFLAVESKKRRAEFPKKHHVTWLNDNSWEPYVVAPSPVLSLEDKRARDAERADTETWEAELEAARIRQGA